jgi:hypothetical protein
LKFGYGRCRPLREVHGRDVRRAPDASLWIKLPKTHPVGVLRRSPVNLGFFRYIWV